MLNDIKQNAQTRMAKSIDALRHTLTTIRTGRASPALLDGISVLAYGSQSPLANVATISVSEGRSLVISVFDKSLVSAVEKSIYASDLGLTPTVVGTVIRLNLPPLTEERRKELAKTVGKEGEETKVSIRNIRRDANQEVAKLLKDKEITEDDKKRAEDDIQKLTDNSIKDVDKVVAEKEKELMAV
ncbi:ribosome recycling factor [Stenotrophomonas chelatiphaga]|jgi:ribosome recycling factor|uniref:Ribosome-recycling factor n=1 Tax=Stenotrophomonas chelatiphaga TaxID=517011 RepID=A0A0R0D0R7_9GAMM|nr:MULTISPECIES: ribosome recycling factor [Stenotrophomonas]KRG74742.1 ribosome recycling factor [Stenotrophomonas chelatiphaga]MCS4230161.1 ribosome recycling factor [Stenotrophomonas chelatiphaga]MDR6095215.1 ribosome recycling factor [Stenotrophomonas sp. SORGH_AS_0321]ROQ43739.1 ribosome recycling factor [Stenotrophomonas maltophilia]